MTFLTCQFRQLFWADSLEKWTYKSPVFLGENQEFSIFWPKNRAFFPITTGTYKSISPRLAEKKCSSFFSSDFLRLAEKKVSAAKKKSLVEGYGGIGRMKGSLLLSFFTFVCLFVLLITFKLGNKT